MCVCERERLDEIKRKIEKDNRKTVQIYRCLIRECVCVRELVRVYVRVRERQKRFIDAE